jgi:hypothetical protein
MTLDTMVAFDTIVAFYIPLVSLAMMWCKEHLRNFSDIPNIKGCH